MPKIVADITIDAPVDQVFAISNDLESWPKIMPEYRSVNVFDKEGKKIWFRISHMNGTEWVSWRIIDRGGLFACAERHEPKAPFRFMHIVWTYRQLSSSRTLMRWDMEFSLLDEAADEDTWIANFKRHTEENQIKMKTFIEALCESSVTRL